MVQALIFDIGGVMEDAGATKRIAQVLARKYGVDENYSFDLFRKYNDAIDRGTFSLADYLGELKKKYQLNINYEEFISILHQAKNFNKDVIGLAKKLKERYKLYVLSNNFPENVVFYKKNGFSEIFEKMFVSCEIGYLKPEPQIYNYALKNIPFPKQEVLFIDDVKENVEAAQKMGIHALQFRSYGQLLKELKNREIIKEVN